ncbi:MAG: glycoside hydrolase family 127 protein [Bacteroidota bacterium]|nr:glycoside hydrolase family 127 protein [Bacteroidota bacterium]
MKTVSRVLTALIAALFLVTISVNARGHADAKYRVKPVVALKAKPFSPAEVRLLDGPFRHAMKMDAEYILSLEPDRLLSWFRKEAGLPPKAPVYGGWESLGLAGHTLGHYLSACARMYLDTGDKRFLDRVNDVIAELDTCQKANGNGYIAAIPDGKNIFGKVSRGEIETESFGLNGGWSPWYTIHKLLAGLRDSYVYCGNETAKNILIHCADWVFETTKNLDDAQWQKMLVCEYGGMNEVMADVYAITGDKKYLEVSRKFYDNAVLGPLSERRDDLNGLHANTQFPKIIGLERIYELTGDSKLDSTAKFFWRTVVYHHSYVTGGNSNGEYFGPPDTLNDYLSSNTTESCNTYNMLKLTRRLFIHNPEAKYADYYERAVWNHILASQNPQNGMMCYYISLEPGGHKSFMTPFNDFACCGGTGMENHARYNDNIYFHDDSSLYVNLFIASELTWTEKKIRIRQETNFPESGNLRFVFDCEKPVKLALKLRHPFWATKEFSISINGMPIAAQSNSQSYVTLDRVWKNHDTVEVHCTMFLRTEAMPDNPNRVAVFYGPVLLAGNLGSIKDHVAVPALLTNMQPVSEWMGAVPGKSLTFRTKNVGQPNDVELIPFYQIHDRKYSVYWDVFTNERWKAEQTEEQKESAEQKDIDARTVDAVTIGDSLSERSHDMRGEKTNSGELMGKRWRHATNGGWFSFAMNVDHGTSNDLVVTYWGSETHEREFDIMTEGEKIATQTLLMNKRSRFFNVTYALPDLLVKGKDTITVKFQARPANIAGGVFGVRVVKRSVE